MTENIDITKLFIGIELKATIFNLKQLDENSELTDLPHLALVGRSNVGKSSLLNCLAGRKSLAKVSASPGKTRSINLYQGHDYKGIPLLLADLPGYGYAKCSHSERESWRKLIEYYFDNAQGLKGLILLLDSRIAPQDSDKEMARYALNRGMFLVPVLTKVDKINQRERSLRQNEWENILNITPLLVSSKNRFGVIKMCEKMLELLEISV
ncbi:ribosome biogenesis GTP-binding protein YihA/YsxC [Desulfovibrio litoralis]|uniref:Probable GTP-binding protein EngB n=1 Tax=Desulfovibrio litoralis DSM 11393 TaxID=1121455 RepID=A0A1M7RTX9_9BACT|nr:ribosome biogenesis GTP-binding protein YihA/YsxC [Desulfovibrio litoralis]SHN49797.1 GTP-binding protein [Desulfovibrio litoralis DSM 11393]